MLNATASRAAKEHGMQLSIMFDGEWSVAVMVELRAWLARRAAEGHETFTFEQFRHAALRRARFVGRFIYWTCKHGSAKHAAWVCNYEGLWW